MKSQKKKLSLVGVLTLILIFFSACGSNDSNQTLLQQPYEDTEFLMGTYVTLRIYDEEKEAVLEKGFNRVKDLADRLSGETQESEITAVNKAAGENSVVLSEDIYDLVKYAADYTAESKGEFDYAIGPITDLWRIGFDDARKPEQVEIDEALKLVDYKSVELNDKEHSVFLKKEGMMLDLGAIAKGYMADEIHELFEEEGVTTAIIDLGGNVFVMGGSPSRDGEFWNVGVQDPLGNRGESIGSTKQTNQSIVTSGIYERYLEVDGKLYHHLMDPDVGYPFENEIAGISIISEKSVDGDALSTLVFGLGLEAGLEYVNQRDGVEAVFISKDKDIYLSDGLKDNFELTSKKYTLIEE
ncbi:FAD:protein FMN transferase [Jeotgalibaca sp. MA1X17-3]|uniref:FAD:protein FMN transferase n=1 Tax=Jeotgalibaca sp. MA1X17-3 TaxID=2908211 RepID=UPI001F403EFE|nr:FAD:protein FMN transferase [Jeotgalibaca sp. MA1X17-3]UJF15754.1 FAD:protein FMN transferase [Jeotgalibaca sp. MA1X17-3]